MIGVKQAVIAGLGVSAVAGGGYGTYYLLKDKTIEDSLNREEFNLIKISEGYQVAFKELRKNSDFIKDIKTDTNQITENSDFSAGGLALNNWCGEKIKESLSIKDVDNLINKVKEYCKNRALTIGDKLVSKLLTTGWDKKLASLKTSETQKNTKLAEDLKTIDKDVTSLDLPTKEKVEKALKDWCSKEIKTHLINDKNDEIFEKVENRCTNK